MKCTEIRVSAFGTTLLRNEIRDKMRNETRDENLCPPRDSNPEPTT